MESQRRTTPVWVTRAFLFLISRDLLELASAESADSDVDANAAAVHASDRRKCAGSHTQNPRVCQTHSVRSSRVRGRERTSERSQRLRDCQRTSPADLSARTRQAGRQAMAEIDRWSSLARTARAQRTQCKHTRTAGERPSAAHPSLSLSLCRHSFPFAAVAAVEPRDVHRVSILLYCCRLRRLSVCMAHVTAASPSCLFAPLALSPVAHSCLACAHFQRRCRSVTCVAAAAAVAPTAGHLFGPAPLPLCASANIKSMRQKSNYLTRSRAALTLYPHCITRNSRRGEARQGDDSSGAREECTRHTCLLLPPPDGHVRVDVGVRRVVTVVVTGSVQSSQSDGLARALARRHQQRALIVPEVRLQSSNSRTRGMCVVVVGHGTLRLVIGRRRGNVCRRRRGNPCACCGLRLSATRRRRTGSCHDARLLLAVTRDKGRGTAS